MMKTKLLFAVATATLLAACGTQSSSRDQIRAVGSSTVYPFAKAISDSLAKSNTEIKSPIIESTGTGAGAGRPFIGPKSRSGLTGLPLVKPRKARASR